MAETFGSFIRQIRESHGIPLRRLANQIGIAPGYMSDIEKGRRNPPMGRLERIATALCMTKEEKEKMYDLAGNARNEIPDDIAEYMKEHGTAQAVIRQAMAEGRDDTFWAAIRGLMR